MKTESTVVTTKGQTTIPSNIREILGVRPKEKVEWHIVKGMIVVDKTRKMENPVKFLTSQIKINLDAVKLVRETREESI